MMRRLVYPALALCVAGLGALALLATAPEVESVTPERAIPTVRTLTPRRENVRLKVRSQGTVAPRTESTLVPEVSGRVMWVSPALVSGGFFAEGEPLLRIDVRDYELAVRRTRSAVARVESELEFAAAELKRQERLSARNVASTAQLSAARRAGRVAEASLAEARVALEQSQWDLERTELVAPFEGRVRVEQVDVGQFVNRGASVATLYATDYVEIRLPIADHQLAFLDLPDLQRGNDENGPDVRLHARFAGREHEWLGRVVRTEGEIDARSRMVHVVARVEDPYAPAEDGSDRPALAVGLFVQADIAGPMAKDVIVMPRYAMRDDRHILVVDAQDRLHTREVEVLRIDRDDVLIQSVLGPNERICVSPVQVVVEGMRVKPIPADVGTAPGVRS
jgi:RND family efflux transporter MFP subunit